MTEQTAAEKAPKAGKNKKAEATPVEKAPKAPGVGDKAKELIRAGKTNEEVLAGVKEAFPDCSCSMASVNWYRNNLRQAGEKVPTSRELSAANKPPKEPKAPKEKKPRGKKAETAASEAAQADAEGASHLQ